MAVWTVSFTLCFDILAVYVMQDITHITAPNRETASASTPRSLNYKQAAERLGVSVITVRRWVAAKRLRVQRYSATCVRIPETEISRLEKEALV